jgi:beta-glucosidase/6-phospho-beta-glucosidase/beta-galactosidase
MGLSSTISFKTNGGYKVPLTNSSDDTIAVQRAWDFNEGWFVTPVFLTGDYPRYLKEYTSTFLRDFTADEMAAINGSCDIFMHDPYTSQLYMTPDEGSEICLASFSDKLFPSCANTTYIYIASSGGWDVGYAADPGVLWLHKATGWVPKFLYYIQETWKPSQTAISEFGFAEPFEELK